MADKLEVLPGQGMVARFGEIAVWAGPQCSPALQAHLVTEAQRAAREPGGGEQLANSLISVLQRGDPEPQAPFAVIGPAPGGLMLLLHGPVQAWDSGRWLAPQPVPGWMTASIARPWPLIVLPYGANPPPQSQQGNPFDLLAGVVPGSGFVMLRPPSAPASGTGTVAAGAQAGAMPPAGVPSSGPSFGMPSGGQSTGPGAGLSSGPFAGPGSGAGPQGPGPGPQGPGGSPQGSGTGAGPQGLGPYVGPGPVAGGLFGSGTSPSPSPSPLPEAHQHQPSGVGPGPGAGSSGPLPSFGGAPASSQGSPTGGPSVTQSPGPGGFAPLAPPVVTPGTAAAGAPSTLDLRHVLVPGSPPLPLASSPGAALDRPEAPGVYCDRGHFNHPGASRCARCGHPIAPGSQAVSGPRPPVGVLLADDGSIWALDKSYLIGADPTSAGEVRTGAVRAIAMRAGANHTMSPVQAEVKVSGWSVYLVDRGAEGGAYWQGSSSSGWVQLGRNEQRELPDGSHLSCGGRVLTYLSAWAQPGAAPQGLS